MARIFFAFHKTLKSRANLFLAQPPVRSLEESPAAVSRGRNVRWSFLGGVVVKPAPAMVRLAGSKRDTTLRGFPAFSARCRRKLTEPAGICQNLSESIRIQKICQICQDLPGSSRHLPGSARIPARVPGAFATSRISTAPLPRQAVSPDICAERFSNLEVLHGTTRLLCVILIDGVGAMPYSG